ncbi:MAG: AAA family ATPase [Rhodospirillales bacterium]|nr:AAA family ATPase [Rhodospirillales bacterium]
MARSTSSCGKAYCLPRSSFLPRHGRFPSTLSALKPSRQACRQSSTGDHEITVHFKTLRPWHCRESERKAHYVTSLPSRIKTLRQALGDDGTDQTCIRTVRRRGFRLVAPVEEIATQVLGPRTAMPALVPAPVPREFVGREGELTLLRALLGKACAGRRQVVFVTGEPGIGKSTLVRTFLSSVSGPVRASVANAQCIELYGTSEPYLPIFEAMQRLGTEIGVDKLASYLRSFAPSWLAQMPVAERRRPAHCRCERRHLAARAARARPGARSAVGGQADRALAGRPPVERSLDPRCDLLPGTAVRTGESAGDRLLPSG